MNKYIVLFLFVLASILLLQAQSVGINVLNPTAPLHIQTNDNTAASNAVKITNNADADKLVLSNAANMAINKPATNLRLDLRGSGTDNIIGIGTTTLSAAAAKEGAIRYDPDRKQLQYSDGENWYYLITTTPRACVVYVNNNMTFGIPNNTETILGGWTRVYDPLNSFNSNGTFVAPRDGAYFTVLSFAFVGNGNAGVETEARWLHYRNGELIDMAKAKTAYTFGGNVIRQAICYVSFSLQKGDILRPAAWHNTGFNQTMMTGTPVGGNGGFNYLTIVIQ